MFQKKSRRIRLGHLAQSMGTFSFKASLIDREDLSRAIRSSPTHGLDVEMLMNHHVLDHLENENIIFGTVSVKMMTQIRKEVNELNLVCGYNACYAIMAYYAIIML
ncbi:hypothetical protein AVEN_119680-1 [Araneus ventricosus]|uniref:Uncharacterized protein n=1 Tax=Araneus ventricosus TaxID=182803 RepID=A0A4Y2KHM1_ARAVE|nr:hypothetical protein AVEN_119680-1 [Araneus ventricosus]